jgi:hypothetical protein
MSGGPRPVVTPPGYSDLWNMHSEEDFQFGKRMIAWGMNDCAISRLMGISRGTIRDWRTGKVRAGDTPRPKACPRCECGNLNEKAYAYLLGLYLGDGWISKCPRGVFKLRVSMDDRYPGIISECVMAIESLIVGRRMTAGKAACLGCTEVYSHWKHWPCVFPQHGAGPKHLRPIVLAKWQQEIANARPHLLLRGLIHSDGWRGLNRVRRRWGTGSASYAYPQYQFTNYSEGIRGIFCSACDVYGVAWRQMNWNTIAISRRGDVSRLDEVVGPKF